MSLIPVDLTTLTATATFTKGIPQMVVTVSAPASAAVSSPQLTRSFENKQPSLDYKFVGAIDRSSPAASQIQLITVSKTEPWTDLTSAGVPTVTKVGIIIYAGAGSIEGRNVPIPLTIVDPAASTGTTNKPVVTPTPNPTPAVNTNPTPNPSTNTNATPNPTPTPSTTTGTNTTGTNTTATIPKPQPIPDFDPPGLSSANLAPTINITLPINQMIRITAPTASTTSVEGVAGDPTSLRTWRAGSLNAQTSYWDLIWVQGSTGNVSFSVTTVTGTGKTGRVIQTYMISVGKAVGV